MPLHNAQTSKKFTQARSKIQKKISKDLWRLYATKEPFARGGEAEVFRKRDINYPRSSFFHSRGEIVKVFDINDMRNVRKLFWSFKIAHELFPQNVPIVSGFRRTPRGTVELHIQEVPIHKELEEYQEYLRKQDSEGHIFSSKKYKACERICEKYFNTLESLDVRMTKAGIHAQIFENDTNVSLADPKKPVVLELVVIDPKAAVEYAIKKRFSKEKIKRIRTYTSRLVHSYFNH